MTEIAVATWNLDQGVDKHGDNIAATWRYLEHEVRPTVALVQEAFAKTIPETAGGSFYWPADPVPYDTALLAYAGSLEPLPDVITRYSTRRSFAIRPTVPARQAPHPESTKT